MKQLSVEEIHLGHIRLICRYISQDKEYCKKYKIAYNWDTCYNCENIQRHKCRAKLNTNNT